MSAQEVSPPRTAPAAVRREPEVVRSAGRRPLDLVAGLRATLGLWLASRFAVLLLSLAGARAVADPRGDEVPGLTTLWDRWDVGLFRKVAEFGYLSPAYSDRTEVDLPGMPLAMRVAHLLVRDWIVAGLVVSLIAGAVASAALWRLAEDDGPGRGRRAVLALVLFPYAVFLFAGYSEGIFLAFATVGWLAATRRRWALAGLLVAGATGTRILGLPMLLALWVHYAVTVWPDVRTRVYGWRRAARELPWLALPLAPLAAFLAYFQVREGHWDAYTRAMREHWGRGLALPWEGLATTWRQAVNPDQASAFQVFWWAELLAVAIGVVLTVALLRTARWGEAAFVGGSTVIMACSSYWASGVRAVLVWFPLYLWLSRRPPRALSGYVWVCAPLMAVFVLAFTAGNWVD